MNILRTAGEIALGVLLWGGIEIVDGAIIMAIARRALSKEIDEICQKCTKECEGASNVVECQEKCVQRESKNLAPAVAPKVRKIVLASIGLDGAKTLGLAWGYRKRHDKTLSFSLLTALVLTAASGAVNMISLFSKKELIDYTQRLLYILSAEKLMLQPVA